MEDILDFLKIEPCEMRALAQACLLELLGGQEAYECLRAHVRGEASERQLAERWGVDPALAHRRLVKMKMTLRRLGLATEARPASAA